MAHKLSEGKPVFVLDTVNSSITVGSSFASFELKELGRWAAGRSPDSFVDLYVRTADGKIYSINGDFWVTTMQADLRGIILASYNDGVVRIGDCLHIRPYSYETTRLQSHGGVDDSIIVSKPITEIVATTGVLHSRINRLDNLSRLLQHERREVVTIVDEFNRSLHDAVRR